MKPAAAHSASSARKGLLVTETNKKSTAESRRHPRGQKPPLKPKEIWTIRIRLQIANRARDLALFNLAIDSKLRGCDLVALRVRDIPPSGAVAARAIVMQRKTQRPVQFEITDQTTPRSGSTQASTAPTR